MAKQATREAYGKALVKLGEKHDNVVVLDADLSKSTKTAEFSKAFPERFINAGIAEQNMIGMAAGLATTGKVVFASSFAIFAVGRAFEQVRNSIAYADLNVKISATHSGITVGEDGGSHQSVEDIAIMRSVPNLSVVVPADGVTAEKAVFSVYDHQGPVYLRLGRPSVPVIHDENVDFKIGKGIEIRSGKDVTLISCGIMVAKCLEAADILKQQGIEASVIDMHTIKPIDQDLIIKKAQETKAILTVEEHSVIGGLGSAVCEVVSEKCPVLVHRMGIKDIFGQSGTPDELLKHYGLSTDKIVENTLNLLKNI
ncbi:Transketolase, C-terminal section [Candidatus Syntrophocurvum alkaliphilum]|uniref:Transketolase, C-terminal section n=1 Tax=Candidatus Syntrophocurvum alkaliphilum TaxID=2293317 RepID=A0A6I6DHF4_9FIRM|nr:transketolase family protein [Candidatus Syntrophocurvum alkaliphilum]QGU00384.1 Transketolase, C-terminal section [Candidatus Syntrophocurvum alkaliphilum]